MWFKFCVVLLTMYDPFSKQNLEPLCYIFLILDIPPLYTSRLVAMLCQQHQRLVYVHFIFSPCPTYICFRQGGCMAKILTMPLKNVRDCENTRSDGAIYKRNLLVTYIQCLSDFINRKQRKGEQKEKEKISDPLSPCSRSSHVRERFALKSQQCIRKYLLFCNYSMSKESSTY